MARRSIRRQVSWPPSSIGSPGAVVSSAKASPLTHTTPGSCSGASSTRRASGEVTYPRCTRIAVSPASGRSGVTSRTPGTPPSLWPRITMSAAWS